MLYLSFKDVVSRIRRGDNLPDRQTEQNKNLTTFWPKKILTFFSFNLSVYVQKELESYLCWFSYNITIPICREILQKIGKGQKLNCFKKKTKNYFKTVTWGIMCQNFTVLSWTIWLELQGHTHTATNTRYTEKLRKYLKRMFSRWLKLKKTTNFLSKMKSLWTANDHSLKEKDIIWQNHRSLSF